MNLRPNVGSNQDCNLVSRLWNYLDNPDSGQYYLGNIIKNGLKVPEWGIDIPPFATIQVGDIPEQTMFKWALEYLGVAMNNTVVSGLDTFTGGTMTCTPVSNNQTEVSLSLNFGQVTYSGNYDVGTSGVTGCAIASAAAILGGNVSVAALGTTPEQENLELAAWYRDQPLQKNENGKTLVGTYYLQQDAIEAVTTSDTNGAKQYRQTLAQQKTTSDAVKQSTLYYKQQQEGQNPPGAPPKIGSPTQYGGGFQSYVKLQYATQQMMTQRGLALKAGDNEYAELMNAMTQFNGQVLGFQAANPGEQDTSKIIDYVATAPPVEGPAALAAIGSQGIPVFDEETGEIISYVPTWPLDRAKALKVCASRLTAAAAVGDDAWFHIKGPFQDIAQGLTLSVTADFNSDQTGLTANVTAISVTIANLHIVLDDSGRFDRWPGLYAKVAEWIANTQSFQDTLKSKLNGALDSDSVRQKLSDALNAGLKKLGL
jgi:hypothetical protein